jgi:hypothetical protein
MTFQLYDAGTGGSQVGTPITRTVPVNDGLFTVALDFGSSVFTGDARWLGIQVKCPGDAAYVSLGRQALTAAPYALYAASAWRLGGNAGTTPGVDYLGTSDSVTLTLAVNGAAALRLVPDADSSNVIGGHSANSVAAGVRGATIGGGGNDTYPNRVTDHYATVGGGYDNTASGGYATVGGGVGNTASGPLATVAGGRDNTASGKAATVAGGDGNTASGDAATVAGGGGNTASGGYATVGGGVDNTASGKYATVGGGFYNTASGQDATVGGGVLNRASGDLATVGGGWNNTASGSHATVGGGHVNKASGFWATVGGGYWNTASGYAATVAGGWDNTADGDYSFAAGRRARAAHQGAFVWADSTNVDYTSTITDQFAIRASNGVSLSVDAGSGKAIAVGERYRDNAIIAWATVISDGTTGANSFGVESVTHIGAGMYEITITAQTGAPALLIPIAVAVVDEPFPPYIVSISQISARTFEVYVYVSVSAVSDFGLVDNGFVFMVTGR